MSALRPGLHPYAFVTLGLAAGFLVLFAAVQAVGIELLTDPRPQLGRGGIGAALLGVGLLVGDVVLPVPSSLVMLAHGAYFGFALGAALSLVGSVGAAGFGFWLGRSGSPLLDRVVTPSERARADALLVRWGGLAVLVSRPVPIVAETVAVIAGTSPLGWGRLLAMAALGSLPAALLYALAGASAARLGSSLLVFALVLALAALVGWLGRREA